MGAPLTFAVSCFNLARRVPSSEGALCRSGSSRSFGLNTAIFVVAVAGALLVTPALLAQDRPVSESPIAEAQPLLQLRVPKAQAGVFIKALSVAHGALEAGRSDEARQAFAEVFRLLDVMEENPAHRESVILAKATLYARTFTDRVSAQRELARVLQINPASKQALALAARLKQEKFATRQSPSDPPPAVPLVPRLTGKKGEAP